MADTKQNVDLRKKVQDDRGLVKKIEMWIPGFRGYRKREDLRIADSLLRSHLADRIKTTGIMVEECRDVLVKKMKLNVLDDVGKLVNKLNTIEGRVRHAEQGYTGISSDYRINTEELNRLYVWDLELLEYINKLNTAAISFRKTVDNDVKTAKLVEELDMRLTDFNQLFDKRIQIVAGLM